MRVFNDIISRPFTVIAYLGFSVLAMLALVETLYYEKYFHIPIFFFFIIIYFLGAYSSFKYQVDIEMVVIKVSLVLLTISLIPTILLTFRLPLPNIIPVIIIIIMELMWFFQRLLCIRHLREDALELNTMVIKNTRIKSGDSS